jgi:ribosomal protein S18 acetylase RimI-like enzyme
MSVIFTTIQNNDQLHQILQLQRENLRHTKSIEVEAEQGFVTVEHDISLLADMNTEASHVIALDDDRVVGYALAMTRAFEDKVPVLAPMFELLDNLVVDGTRMGNDDYIVMGQICVDKDYRGQGLVQGLYKKYFELYKSKYHWIVTEIAARNTRSLHAHMKVGFKEIYRYDEVGFEQWIVVRF